MMCVGLRRCVVRPSGVSCANVFSRVRGPRTVVELEGEGHDLLVVGATRFAL